MKNNLKKLIKKLLLVFFLLIIYSYTLVITNLPDELVVFEGETIFMKTLKYFTVSGEIHGSIVIAKTRQQAEFIFKKHYPNEKIWSANKTRSFGF